MPSLNKIMIIGHLGRNPDMKTTQSGDLVANFSVAVSEKYKGVESTEWFNVVAWTKTAEIVQKYLSKGNPVYVEGRLKTREYEARDKTQKKVTEIIASHIVLLGGSKDTVSQDRGAPRTEADDSFDDDDIPF